MIGKRAIFFVFAVSLLLLLMNSTSEAIDTAEIDRVRNKGVLDSKDFKIIDSFVAEAVRELVETRDFTSIAKHRTVILSRSSSSEQSAAAQYAEQFSESAYKYISKAFEEAEELIPEEQKHKVIVNLLILVDGLEDIRLAELGTKMVHNDSSIIRYWAVHSITNPGFIKQLNPTATTNLEIAESITKELKKVVNEVGPETLALIAEFAAEVDIPQAEALLLQAADMRISKYADWTVKYELLDGTILKLLDNKIPTEGENTPAIARRFAQLYSYAIQRYVKGQDYLNGTQKQQLASVLVETEILCISRRLRMAQSIIKKAVEEGDFATLTQEHSRLLGDETRAGQLAVELKFDYGEKADDSKRTAPLLLPGPPKIEAGE
ncbi:MAG: hypothetical protein JSV82_05185 [Planctomycetota bacterium]|nr:MAG: hypothetical protein JSV82_05185 [Planctomycetota bacterium]